MRAAHLLWTFLAVLAFGLFGCADKRTASSAPYDEYGGYGYVEDRQMAELEATGYAGDDVSVYDFEDDMVEGETLTPAGASLSSRGRSKQASMMEVRGSFDAPAPDPSAGNKDEAKARPEPRPSTATTTRDQDDRRQDQPPAQTRRRQVIYNASMVVSVYRVEEAVDFAEALPADHGGWVEERANMRIVLRVPAARLDEVMTLIAEQGTVELRTLQSFDVTDRYTDLESRIRILAETQAQLNKLLAQAKTVEESLEVRKALDAVTMELELARARMRELSSAIAFSTLVVEFRVRGPIEDVPSTNDPFPWVLNLGVESTEYR